MQGVDLCYSACMASKATGTPKEPAAGAKPGSGPESDVRVDQKQKKRHTLFQRVPSSQRCGECHTCLLPHLKKPCLTIRAQQERQLRRAMRKEASTAARTASGSSAAGTSGSDSLDPEKWKPKGHQRAWTVHGPVRNDGHIRIKHGCVHVPSVKSMYEDLGTNALLCEPLSITHFATWRGCSTYHLRMSSLCSS